MTDDDKRCPKCDKPMEWTITADARIWNCLESSCDDVAPVVEEGHFCPKCGAVHIDDDLRVQYNCILHKGHAGPHYDYGMQFSRNSFTGEEEQHKWWIRWTDNEPREKVR